MVWVFQVVHMVQVVQVVSVVRIISLDDMRLENIYIYIFHCLNHQIIKKR